MQYKLYLSNLFIGVFGGENETQALDRFAQANACANFDDLNAKFPKYKRADARLVALPQLETLEGQPGGIFIEFHHLKDKEKVFYVGPFDNESQAQIFMAILSADTVACVVNHESDE